MGPMATMRSMAPMGPMTQMAPMHGQPMRMMTIMAPVMRMPPHMHMAHCQPPPMLAPMPQVTQPSTSAVAEQPQANSEPASQPRKVRHNLTERRRVQKLKYAFVELDGALRARPDLVSIATASSADPSFRKRGRDDLNGDRLPVGRRMPVGPSQTPSHLQILQDSAETVDSLFKLIDMLSGEIDRISKVPDTGAKLIKKTQGIAEDAPLVKQQMATAETGSNDDDDGTEDGGDDE